MIYKLLGYLTNYDNVYFIITLLTCIGIVISSCEYLVIKDEFKLEGVFSWKIFSSRKTYLTNSFYLKRVSFIFSYSGFILLQVVRIASCLIVPFVNNFFIKSVLLSIIAITSLIFSFRNIIGNDGSDQMNSIICITLFLVFLFQDAFIFKLGLIFIATQSILSYVIAGTAKIISVKWTNGTAIAQIMNSKTYGHRRISMFLSNSSKGLNYLICWFIIVFEILFFLVILLPNPWFFVFLIWGFAFHVYNAIAMGLNNFFWAFLATYPSLIYVNQLINSS